MRTLGVMGILKVPYQNYSIVCPEATTEDGASCDANIGLVQNTTYTHIKDFPVRTMYPAVSRNLGKTQIFIAISTVYL